MSDSSNRNRFAKMRLQKRYNSNSSNGNSSTATQTIGGNSNSNMNINGNNRIHNQRAKLLNLISNNNKRNSNNNNNSNGYLKLRSTTKSTPTTTTSQNHCKSNNNNNKNQAMQLEDVVDNVPHEEEIVETLEETTTAVELRSTAGSTANSSGHGSSGRAYTTLRSNSTSAILAEVVRMPSSLMGNSSSMLYARPRTLNVHNICQTPAQITQMFFGYVFILF